MRVTRKCLKSICNEPTETMQRVDEWLRLCRVLTGQGLAAIHAKDNATEMKATHDALDTLRSAVDLLVPLG